jgi:hypothetical protein
VPPLICRVAEHTWPTYPLGRDPVTEIAASAEAARPVAAGTTASKLTQTRTTTRDGPRQAGSDVRYNNHDRKVVCLSSRTLHDPFKISQCLRCQLNVNRVLGSIGRVGITKTKTVHGERGSDSMP